MARDISGFLIGTGELDVKQYKRFGICPCGKRFPLHHNKQIWCERCGGTSKVKG